MKTREERFWEKVRRLGDEKNHCWEWTATINNKGYGQFWDGSKVILAHHFLSGKPPEGKESCHRCDNPKCVRPSHLFVGTRKDNMQDCVSKGRYTPTWQNGAFDKMRACKPPMNGEDNPIHKLTKYQASEAANCPREYGAAVRMARRFGVSSTVICGIRNGKRWKHLRVKGLWVEGGAE